MDERVLGNQAGAQVGARWQESHLARDVRMMDHQLEFAPAGYKSWEERQEEATLNTASAVSGTELEDARKRQERVRELRPRKRGHWKTWKQRFKAEFEIWEAELTDERRRALAPNVTPGTHVEKALLREAFAKESGLGLSE